MHVASEKPPRGILAIPLGASRLFPPYYFSLSESARFLIVTFEEFLRLMTVGEWTNRPPHAIRRDYGCFNIIGVEDSVFTLKFLNNWGKQVGSIQ